LSRLTRKPTVPVVDDMPAELQLISALLREHTHVRIASSGAQALQIIESFLTRSDPAGCGDAWNEWA
jgi:putative two-component system response regulator